MTRLFLLACAVAMLGCGGNGKKPVAPDPAPPKVEAESRSEIESRRDAACEALGPRITACAIEEARATMSPEELAKLDLEKTAPVHTEEFIAECKRQQLSSRQVRVYEVCLKEETECEPLITCLDNVNAPATP
jgi:hypothetical protein